MLDTVHRVKTGEDALRRIEKLAQRQRSASSNRREDAELLSRRLRSMPSPSLRRRIYPD